MPLPDAIDFIRRLKEQNPSADKASVVRKLTEHFKPTVDRSVLVSDGYAMRISEVRAGSFSNTVLSLSALRKHDQRPFVVTVVRPKTVDFLLANSTFLKKISHSSLQLRTDNIKGSFNGTDIMIEYEGLANAPKHFDDLMAHHLAFTWEENVERLVEATNSIVGRDSRFRPSASQEKLLMTSPDRAAAALRASEFQAVEDELRKQVQAKRKDILSAARIDNVNIRGNRIEQMITGNEGAHDLGDLTRKLRDGLLVVDIKTKLLDRASAPKAYNIDKMLNFLSQPGSVLAFFMIGVDIHSDQVSGRLLPVLETSLINATRIQHHWAGRSSRGVTQLSGDYHRASRSDYKPVVDIDRARAFLKELLRL